MRIRSSLLFGMAALIMSSAIAQEATGDPEAGFKVGRRDLQRLPRRFPGAGDVSAA
jgi:hypothetical protein